MPVQHSAQAQMLEQATAAAQQELGCQDPVLLLLSFEQLKLRTDTNCANVKDSIPDLQQSLEVCIEQRGCQDVPRESAGAQPAGSRAMSGC